MLILKSISCLTVLWLVLFDFINCEGVIRFKTDESGASCLNSIEVHEREEIDGDEVRASNYFECADYNKLCIGSKSFDHVQNITHKTDINVNANKLHEAVRKSIIDNGITVSLSVRKSGNLDCETNPGWKSWIAVKPRLVKVEGQLMKKCYSYDQNGKKLVEDITENIIVFVPKVRSNEDFDGTVSCKSVPIANMSNKSVRPNPRKLTIGFEYDAVGQSCWQAMENTVNGGVEAMAFRNISGHEVWAQGKCRNDITRFVCKGCLQKLLDDIWKECGNSRGCTFDVEDCMLRYEFFEFK